jgi:dTMP kinase
MTKDNFFLVIEGMDGSGKTEIARRLAWMYRIKFADHIYLTFEPHDPSCAGLFIRQVLMKKIKESDFSHLTLALAFAANRLDHWYRDIRPFLSTGKQKIVISDRYRLSSLVYQVRGDLTIKDVLNFNREAPSPDLTIFLNASNKICHERMQRRDQDKELFETKLDETRNAYHRAIRYLRKNLHETILEVNADGDVNEVFNDVVNLINEHAPEWMISQQILRLNYQPDAVVINGNSKIKLMSVAERLRQHWEGITFINPDHLREVLDTIKAKISETVTGLRSDQLASIFMQYLNECGY